MAVSPDLPPAVLLMGATGTGKTALAVELVQRLPLSIISVDSAMVFRGMDIGTAKPGPEVLAVAPHRLIDIVDPADSYSAARFRADALREMAAITAAGRVPLLVGGTGLYFRALERGLTVLPAADPGLRARLGQEVATTGLAPMYRRLRVVDPATADRLHANDRQRILRALEVCELAGRPMSAILDGGPGTALPYRLVKLILDPRDRDRLRLRCADRFRAMLGRGFIDEVRTLLARGDLHPELPSMRVVGYRQALEYLQGKYGYDDMVRRAVIATHQLAKRQQTWLRAEPGALRLDPERADLTAFAIGIIERGLGLSN